MASIGINKDVIKEACELLIAEVGKEVVENDRLVVEMDTTGGRNIYVGISPEHQKVRTGLLRMAKAQTILNLCTIANDYIMIDDEEYNLLYKYLNLNYE